MQLKNLIFALLIVFSVVSFIRLLSNDPAADHFRRTHNATAEQRSLLEQEDPLTPKEYALLKTTVLRRRPCNILFFGVTAEALRLAKLNVGGRAVFLHDGGSKIWKKGASLGVSFHAPDYRFKAGEAYSLLAEARATPACRPGGGLRASRCRLAMTGLPAAVADEKWDVIVVDGPNGAAPEEPGRMAAIYSSAVMARTARPGGATDVFVHNVDRTAEKWFAWEFLCEENLVRSKGRLWHFGIAGGGGDRSAGGGGAFCEKKEAKIL